VPSSGFDTLTVRILGVVGAAAILVNHYSTEVGLGLDSNFLLEAANTVVVGLVKPSSIFARGIDFRFDGQPRVSQR
jgi:hypothetical protein